MDWLRANGLWIFIFVVFIAAHLFGHGGHGGHGRRAERRAPPAEGEDETRRPSGHQH